MACGVEISVPLSARERILACLAGVATGDAVGKQTEGLARDDLRFWYPHGIRGFEGAAGSVIPRYAENKKHRWRIGETTDDTERTIAVARAILHDRAVSHASVGREMLACTKCVHPGVRSLWEFHQAGDAGRVTADHDGCGAAIRVAPVGIFYRSHRFEDILEGARQASIPTHGGPMALAAAAATAIAISAAVDGAGADEIRSLARAAGERTERQRSGAAVRVFVRALDTIHGDLQQSTCLDPDEIASRYSPTTPFTIVPLALALGTVMTSAQEAIRLAANVGGDTDSVASIAGALLGARFPSTVNPDWFRVVEQINGHGLSRLGEELAALRS